MTKFEVDLSDADLAYILNDKGAFGPYGSPEGQKIGRQIRDQLPPRMTEPEFGGGNVIDHNTEDPTRRIWVRRSRQHSQWTDGKSAWWWDTLIDPEPVGGAS